MTPLLSRLQAACNLAPNATPRTDEHHRWFGMPAVRRGDFFVEVVSKTYADDLEKELNLRTQQLAKAVEALEYERSRSVDLDVALQNGGSALTRRMTNTIAAIESLESNYSTESEQTCRNCGQAKSEHVPVTLWCVQGCDEYFEPKEQP